MWPFIKSVLFGAFVGAAPVLRFTISLAVTSLPEGLNGDGKLFPVFWLAILPLVVATPIVLGASIIIGLPLTVILQRNKWESGAVYMSVGAAFGFVLPIFGLLSMAAEEGYWMALLGALSGGITGRTWWILARKPKGGNLA